MKYTFAVIFAALIGLGWIAVTFWSEPFFPIGSIQWLLITIIAWSTASLLYHRTSVTRWWIGESRGKERYLVLLAFVAMIAATGFWMGYLAERPVDVTTTLHDFYVEGGEFVNRPVTNDSEWSEYKTDYAEWIFSARRFIRKNMSNSALSVYKDLSNVLPIIVPEAFNSEHQKYVNTAYKRRDNIKSLIENDAWK